MVDVIQEHIAAKPDAAYFSAAAAKGNGNLSDHRKN